MTTTDEPRPVKVVQNEDETFELRDVSGGYLTEQGFQDWADAAIAAIYHNRGIRRKSD